MIAGLPCFHPRHGKIEGFGLFACSAHRSV